MGEAKGGGGDKRKAPAGCYWRGETLWARFKVRGIEYRESLRTSTAAVAVKRRDLRKKAVEDEVVYGDAPPTSWQQAVIDWAPHTKARIRASSLERYVRSLRMLRPFLDGLDVQRITGTTIRAIVKARQAQGVSNATIQRDLAAMSSVLDYACDQGWIERNPCREYDRRQIRHRKPPFILPCPHSLQAVLASGPRAFADAVEFARETGMREEEIFSLHRSQIDEKRACATLRHVKGKRGRAVELSPRALAIYRRQPVYLNSPYLFAHSGGERYTQPAGQHHANCKRVARKAAQDAKAGKPWAFRFQPFTFHAMRHLYAIESLKGGASIYWLQQQLGHSTIKVTEEYLEFLTPEEVDRARGGTNRGTATGDFQDSGAATA